MSNGKVIPSQSYSVSKIEYNESREITALELVNRFGKNVYTMGAPKKSNKRNSSIAPAPAEPAQFLKELTEEKKQMWTSAIQHAAAGESLIQVNTLIQDKGYYISQAGWDRINSSF